MISFYETQVSRNKIWRLSKAWIFGVGTYSALLLSSFELLLAPEQGLLKIFLMKGSETWRLYTIVMGFLFRASSPLSVKQFVKLVFRVVDLDLDHFVIY